MTVITSPASFDEWAVHSCVRQNIDEDLTIDMRACEFVRPAGLVLAACAMLHAKSIDRPVHLVLGPDRDPLRYAERMGLGDIAFKVGADGDEFPVVRRHDPDNEFVELTEFDSSGVVDGAIDDVCLTLLKRSDAWGVDRQRLYNAVFEVGVNVEQHAESTGIVAVQHIRRRRRVEFAIGDIGIGIPESLHKAGHSYPNQAAAVRAAVETSASRMPEHGRGAGLPRMLDIVCGDTLKGYLIVQTHKTRIVYMHRPGQPPSVTAYPVAYSWPGTFVFGSLVTKGGTT